MSTSSIGAPSITGTLGEGGLGSVVRGEGVRSSVMNILMFSYRGGVLL